MQGALTHSYGMGRFPVTLLEQWLKLLDVSTEESRLHCCERCRLLAQSRHKAASAIWSLWGGKQTSSARYGHFRF